MRWPRARFLIPVLVACCVALANVAATQEPNLTPAQIKEFLLTAKVVKSTRTSKGITQPLRLTLTDAQLTHDAAFQTFDEHWTSRTFAGRTETNFVDSYRYDIAAYLLAEMLGLDDIVPITVERKWRGQKGAISWWVPAMMDEADRVKRKISPPDPDAWQTQFDKVRVLNQLVYDTDFNQTNLLITADWRLWRIDFTRAFRIHKELQNPAELTRCDRQLFERLKQLDAAELAPRTKGYLTRWEVEGVLARRDLIVARFQKLIAEKGEDAVLY